MVRRKDAAGRKTDNGVMIQDRCEGYSGIYYSVDPEIFWHGFSDDAIAVYFAALSCGIRRREEVSIEELKRELPELTPYQIRAAILDLAAEGYRIKVRWH